MRSKVLLVDDHSLFLAGLRALLLQFDDLEVVGTVSDGKDILCRTKELAPDLILMDISMPHSNGIESIHDIKSRFPNIKILTLTIHKEDEYIHAALEAGSNGYLLKDDNQEELVDAIRSVLADKTYLSPSICNSVVRGYLSDSSKREKAPSWEQLTHRERQVVKLVAEGHRNKDIAEYLSISLKTVEKHRSNLMKKLDLHSVSELTTYAMKHGLSN